jgi:MerR family redox-sensitive transcriptional activator SoxR
MRTIGELARAFGTQPSALRYYERLGLLHSSKRSDGGRVYDSAGERRLAFIRLGQQAGLSLGEIESMLVGSESGPWRPAAQRRLVTIKEQLISLEEAKVMLEQALSCPDEHPLEMCQHAQRKVDEVLSHLPPPARTPRQMPSHPQAGSKDRSQSARGPA